MVCCVEGPKLRSSSGCLGQRGHRRQSWNKGETGRFGLDPDGPGQTEEFGLSSVSSGDHSAFTEGEIPL